MLILQRYLLLELLTLALHVCYICFPEWLDVPNIWGDPQRPTVHTWLLTLFSQNSHGVNFCERMRKSWGCLSFISKTRQSLSNSPARYSEFQNLYLNCIGRFSISMVVINVESTEVVLWSLISTFLPSSCKWERLLYFLCNI